jgi:hypothetical protein
MGRHHSGRPGTGANSGIIIYGGNSGAVAMGDARATQVSRGSVGGDPLEMIDRLLERLEADAGLLAAGEAGEVVDDARRLRTEVHSRRPSAEGVRNLISRLTMATRSTAALIATVDQIKDLVASLVR